MSNSVALPQPLEAAFQKLERQVEDACGKIVDAAKKLDAGEIDFEDPSVVKHAEDLRQATDRMKAEARPLLPPEGTPPDGVSPPGPKLPLPPLPRLVRPPRRPPRG